MIALPRRTAWPLAVVALVSIAMATGCRRRPAPAPELSELSLSSAPQLRLSQITGTAADDVWAVGERRAFHFDGRAWSEAPDAAGIESIAASARDDVWGVGRAGFIRHFDGKTWSGTRIPEAKAAYLDLVHVAAWPGEAWVHTLEPG